MSFIKKYFFFILCLLGVLIGLGLFIPVKMIASDNEEKLQSLKSQISSVQNLRSKAAQLNISELEEIRKVAVIAEEDAVTIKNKSLESSNRPLIDNEVFPVIPERSHRAFYYNRFAGEALKFINELVTELNAKDKPSYREEQQVIEEYRRANQAGPAAAPGTVNLGAPGAGAIGGAMPGMMPGMGMPGMAEPMPGMGMPGMQMPGMMPDAGMGRAQDRYAASPTSTQAQEERIISDLRKKRAEEITLYASAASFAAYDYWTVRDFGQQRYESLQSNSWFTQIADWIQQDIVASINQINAGSKSVSESRIKRLIEISFNGEDAKPGSVVTGPMIGFGAEPGQNLPGQSAATLASRREPLNQYRLPTYVLDKQGEPVGDLTAAFTQRTCCDLYDVVHFELAVIIDTTAISDFINALQSEKSSPFTERDGTVNTYTRNPITILQYHILPLDIQVENNAGYFYGNGSLCTFRLIGEYIFYKNAYYESLKPDPVRQMFVDEG